jgi:hypothetical protein
MNNILYFDERREETAGTNVIFNYVEYETY